ncbi:MAG: hypothetical protein NC341_09125 [Blautia sp.]|nr:hypothetical protein [Blautia sp.]MCM1201848.1 hypothetical protein [Bacteroides fragilis]
MSNIDRNLEQMVQSRFQGSSLEEAVHKTLGKEMAGRCGGIEKKIDDLLARISRYEAKYAGMDMKMAVFHELDEQCGDNNAEQFSRISDMKFAVSLRNLEISKEKLEEQGEDIEFIREALVKTHEEEQKMAADATAEEIAALREELAAVLPDDRDGIRDSIGQMAADEKWDAVLKEAETAAGGITEQARRDIAVLIAVLYLNEHPEMTAEQAAAAAVSQTSEHSSILLWLAGSAALGVSGFASIFLGLLFGVEFLLTAGIIELGVSTAVLSGLLMLSLGKEAVKAVKAAIPYVKAAWEKCRPHLEKAASKVRFAVASVIGVVANHVLRPAIYWVSNEAVPVIKEKVIHPLKRRLEALLEWLKAKKEQVMNFVKNAAAPAKEDVAQEQEEFEDSEFDSATEDEGEQELEFA